jgi:hypothetical protein
MRNILIEENLKGFNIMLLMTGKVHIVRFRTKHLVNCFDLITMKSGSGKNA